MCDYYIKTTTKGNKNMKKNYKADTTNAYTCFGIDIVSKNAENSGKPKVYTSFYAMYDFTKTIGGDDIDLTNIVPTGTEPHDFEPTASDMAKLSEADIFIYNGVGMESWADKIIETLPQNVKLYAHRNRYRQTETIRIFGLVRRMQNCKCRQYATCCQRWTAKMHRTI